MIDGEPSIDVWAMDIARFGEFATPEWGTVKSSENYERRFVMTFPNETLPKGRRQKTTALYDRLVAKGAVMDQGFGLEHALWFADGPGDAHEDPSFRRSRAHDYVAQEVKAVREAVGCIEIANYSKHAFTGPGARAFLNRVLAGRVPKPGRLALTPMLTEKGKLYGDLTVACLSEDNFMVFGSGAMQEAHRRWFGQRLGTGVDYRNRSDDLHGIGLSGPNSRDLLARITRADVSAEAFRFRDIRQMFVGGVPAIVSRLSFSGELGYEIYVAPQYQIALAEAIEGAGADLGLRWYGARALMSLRLEKAWGVWTLDYRPDFTAAESGLDAFIQWDKEFVGKAAAEAERRAGPAKRLVPLVIDAPMIDSEPIDVSNDEAILRDGAAVGYVSSGGYAHHVGAILGDGLRTDRDRNDRRALRRRDPGGDVPGTRSDHAALRSQRRADAELICLCTRPPSPLITARCDGAPAPRRGRGRQTVGYGLGLAIKAGSMGPRAPLPRSVHCLHRNRAVPARSNNRRTNS